MKKVQYLTLLILIIAFLIPSVVQFSPTTVSNGVEKDYTKSYIHHEQIFIQSDAEFHAQAALESWDGDGSKESPYVITGYLFDCETQPLRVWNTRVHWIFTDNEIFGVGGAIQCGTWIENATNGAIVDNEVHNRHAGLAIADVENFLISGNYIHDCWGRGIELFGAMNSTIIKDNTIDDIGQEGIYSITSRDCIIMNNSISDCTDGGITLVGQTPNCTVTENIISHCEQAGILVSNIDEGEITENIISNVGSHGIYLSASSDCRVTENVITEIVRSGMKISTCEFCEISNNVIENCTEYGLELPSGNNLTIEWNSISEAADYAVHLGPSSSFFLIMYNTFSDNGVACQISDDGTSNIVSHNYYDDWDFPDDDSDGFVDNAYVFEGTAENQDEFPLAVAGIVPTSSTEPETTPTTGLGNGNSMSIDLVLITGAIGAIVIVASLLVIKRR